MLEAIWHTPKREPEYHRHVFASEITPVKGFDEFRMVSSFREIILHGEFLCKALEHL
jgi:hypothetical protein